jgi:hypothetical protein
VLLTLVASPDRTGASTRGAGLAWSVQTLTGDRGEPVGVSCTAVGLCYAADFNGDLFILSGTRSVYVAFAGAYLSGVSCASVRFCVAVGESTAVAFFPTSQRTYKLTYSGLHVPVQWRSISCPSTAFCMAGGGILSGPLTGSGVVASWNGFGWSRVRVVDPNGAETPNDIISLSCGGPNFCVAADGNQHVLQWDGTRWAFPKPLNGPKSTDNFSVSCTSVSFCLALGNPSGATMTWNGNTWHNGPVSAFYYTVGSVSCARPTYCVGVDADGNASSWNGRGWSPLEPVDSGEGLSAVSCSASSWSCEAMGANSHFAYIYDPAKAPRLPVFCTSVGCGGSRT